MQICDELWIDFLHLYIILCHYGALVLRIQVGTGCAYKVCVPPAGQEGGKKNCHGKNGEDLILKVPQGTVVKDANTGKVIADMSGDNKRVVELPRFLSK